MTEYEEITVNKTVSELVKELKYQIDNLGFSFTDSFPDYLLNLIRLKASDFFKHKTPVIVNTGGNDIKAICWRREPYYNKPMIWFVKNFIPMVRVKFENDTIQFISMEYIKLDELGEN